MPTMRRCRPTHGTSATFRASSCAYRSRTTRRSPGASSTSVRSRSSDLSMAPLPPDELVLAKEEAHLLSPRRDGLVPRGPRLRHRGPFGRVDPDLVHAVRFLPG